MHLGGVSLVMLLCVLVSSRTTCTYCAKVTVSSTPAEQVLLGVVCGSLSQEVGWSEGETANPCNHYRYIRVYASATVGLSADM